MRTPRSRPIPFARVYGSTTVGDYTTMHYGALNRQTTLIDGRGDFTTTQYEPRRTRRSIWASMRVWPNLANSFTESSIQ